ncbi:hypothetical protein [Umezawaea sp. Da 62-37]|uniref:hypothetical protein n=1 Tax=Umezawaea sp. Da 62-37 TaxID=3075927 RepID=UPI0028F729D1|nr:hypothetical protein [Umezawaea sp. Da 62-37]WNV87961.1 hypothetical protein RM788_06645 [Umezawaea sp. Da 62-37]
MTSSSGESSYDDSSYSDFDYDERQDVRLWPVYFRSDGADPVPTGLTLAEVVEAIEAEDAITASLLMQQAEALGQGDVSAAGVDYRYLLVELAEEAVVLACLLDDARLAQEGDRPGALHAVLVLLGRG